MAPEVDDVTPRREAPKGKAGSSRRAGLRRGTEGPRCAPSGTKRGRSSRASDLKNSRGPSFTASKADSLSPISTKLSTERVEASCVLSSTKVVGPNRAMPKTGTRKSSCREAAC